MKLHIQINEEAGAGATSAGGGDVAGYAMPLFSKMVKRTIKPTSKKKHVKETVEQLNELSPKTLKSYVTGAVRDAVDRGVEYGVKRAGAEEIDRLTNRHLKNQFKVRDDIKKAFDFDAGATEKARSKAISRSQGVILAADKLARKHSKLREAEVSSSGEEFDSTAVLSKLKSLENKEKVDPRDATTFGLEDDDGQTVRVTVGNEHAAEFEKALQSFLSSEDSDSTIPEIAEILFKLKDHFTIINVEWPEVEEDEEQETELTSEIEGGAEAGQVGSDGGEVDPLAGEDDGGIGGDVDTDSAKSLLVQIIDMMKANAEASKEEALARASEAKARGAEVGVTAAMTKVKREEQILDMETHDKQQKAEEKETKQLARLAKWQHDLGKSSEGDDGELDGYMSQRRGEEEEEMAVTPVRKASITKRVKPTDIAGFILSRMK